MKDNNYHFATPLAVDALMLAIIPVSVKVTIVFLFINIYDLMRGIRVLRTSLGAGDDRNLYNFSYF